MENEFEVVEVVEVESEAVEEQKSAKSPKLSEELSEMNIDESELVTNEPEANEAVKEVLKEIILNCPAGQTEIVGSLCTELFGSKFEGFLKEEINAKLVKDGAFIGGSEGDQEESEDIFERNLKEKLGEYVRELYPGTGKVSIKQCESDLSEWKIEIVGEKLKPKAFWSGHWKSTWTVKFIEKEEQEAEKEEKKFFSLTGKIGLNVHYHEEGSVQLSAEKEIPSRVDFQADTLAHCVDKIYWKIKDSEDSVQVALNEAYQQLAENIFKKLRRQLPVTRTKMDWGKFGNYQLRRELKK